MVEQEQLYQEDDISSKNKAGRRSRVYRNVRFNEDKWNRLTQLKHRYLKYLKANEYEKYTKKEIYQKARADVDAYYQQRCFGLLKKRDARFEPIEELVEEQNWTKYDEEEQRRQEREEVGAEYSRFYY